MERRAFEIVLPLHLGFVDQQCLHQICVVVRRREVQGGSLLVRVAVNFGAILDQEASRFVVANVCCVVQRRPAIGVDVVNVGMAVLNYCLKRLGFIFFWAEDSLVDGSFTKDAHSLINLVTAVDQVPQVLRVSLGCSFIQILDNVTSEFVLANLEGVRGESG